ncbi:MAG: SH3 domain-containing protein [Anaerolineae bacterium]|nr:SH3 domain-containing protein [Anaerolineae bacterium]
MKNTDWHNQRTTPSRRPRRLEEVSSAEVGVPIAWVIIGALAGLLVIGLVGLGVINIIRKQSITPTPPTIPGLAPTQSIAAQTTPEQSAATPTIPPVVTLPPTPTPTPTSTPIPVAPDNLAPGGYAQVTGTEGAGVSLRAGPGTNNARLATAPEGAILLILDGPRDDENLDPYVWWFLRHPDGIEGWAVQDFLVPSLPPPNAQ